MLRRLEALSILAALLCCYSATAQSSNLFQESFEELPPATQPVVKGLSEDLSTAKSSADAEIVRERYDNRRVKVEREVVRRVVAVHGETPEIFRPPARPSAAGRLPAKGGIELLPGV